MTHSLLKKFLHSEDGATIVEFAVVSGIFFTMLLAVIEFGLFTMTQVALESAVTQAGRATSIGKTTVGTQAYPDRATAVTALIQQKTSALINPTSVIISASPVAVGGDAATFAPDLCLVAGGEPTTGPTCASGQFVEVNGINGYQGNGGTTVGSAGDLVEVRVSYPWRVLFPILGQFFGEHGVVMITTSTVIKNEPFGNIQ